jgi:hypothetical protein
MDKEISFFAQKRNLSGTNSGSGLKTGNIIVNIFKSQENRA